MSLIMLALLTSVDCAVLNCVTLHRRREESAMFTAAVNPFFGDIQPDICCNREGVFELLLSLVFDNAGLVNISGLCCIELCDTTS